MNNYRDHLEIDFSKFPAFAQEHGYDVKGGDPCDQQGNIALIMALMEEIEQLKLNLLQVQKVVNFQEMRLGTLQEGNNE